MMNKALAIFFFVSTSALSCEVTLPDHMLVLGPDSGVSPILSKNCPDPLTADLRQVISDLEGKITSAQLGDMLSQKGHSQQPSISPHSVHVKQLRSLIREHLFLPHGVQVRSTSGMDSSNLVSLSPGDRVDVECSSCLFGSQQPLKVLIRGFDGANRTLMVRADFRKIVRAYKVISPVGSFAEIQPQEMLREVYVESIPSTDLVTDLEKVKFYKTNKPIRNGELLKLSDLNAINLVRAGTKTEVIIENALVRIKTQGISRSNGTLGEMVEVFHQQKNKKYLGKVIDLNKILVEL